MSKQKKKRRSHHTGMLAGIQAAAQNLGGGVKTTTADFIIGGIGGALLYNYIGLYTFWAGAGAAIAGHYSKDKNVQRLRAIGPSIMAVSAGIEIGKRLIGGLKGPKEDTTLLGDLQQHASVIIEAMKSVLMPMNASAAASPKPAPAAVEGTEDYGTGNLTDDDFKNLDKLEANVKKSGLDYKSSIEVQGVDTALLGSASEDMFGLGEDPFMGIEDPISGPEDNIGIADSWVGATDDFSGPQDDFSGPQDDFSGMQDDFS